MNTKYDFAMDNLKYVWWEYTKKQNNTYSRYSSKNEESILGRIIEAEPFMKDHNRFGDFQARVISFEEHYINRRHKGDLKFSIKQ